MPNLEEQTASLSPHWSNGIGKRAPNFLSFLRLLVVPLFVFLMIDPTPLSSLWATGLFIIASVTDWFDGYLARIYKAESSLGKLLDPLADKLLVMSALVMLAATPFSARVPAWIVVVLLGRDMIVGGLRSVAAVNGIIVAASRWAKHKTAWTMLAIVFLLIDEPYNVLGLKVYFHAAGMVFLWIALFFSVVTGVAYAISLRKVVGL